MKTPQLDWRIVRGIGRLEILNRASMLLIVIVPFLSAIWSAVPDVLNPANLPNSLAFLFFASLAVLVGRTIYQINCPPDVKDESEDDYILRKKREFIESPSDSAISNAINIIESDSSDTDWVSIYRDNESNFDSKVKDLEGRRKNLEVELEEINEQRDALRPKRYEDKEIDENVERNLDNQNASLKSREQSIYHQLTEVRKQQENLDKKKFGDHDQSLSGKMTLIEISAKIRYQRESGKRIIWMRICALAYSIGVGLIFIVILNQSLSVADSAGWFDWDSSK